MATKKKKAAKKTSAKKTAARKPAAKKSSKAAARRAPARKAKPARKAASAARPQQAADGGARALARRIIQLTVTNDDEGTFAIYAPDVESIEMGQPPTHGIDALRAKFAGWRNMVSEARFEPRRVCVDGNTIIIEWLGRVKMAASGKEAELHEIAVHEVRGGKIVREAFFYNPAALA